MQKTVTFSNKHIDQPFVGPSEKMFGPTKDRKLHKVITNNIIWAYQTKAFLRLLAMFDITCYPAFIKALEIISSFSVDRLNQLTGW